MARLSDRQFAGVAKALNEPDGGFTIGAFGARAGKSPKNAFMVGGAAPEGEVDFPVTPDSVRKYTAENAGALQQSEHYLGGWSYGGKGYLDVSRAFGRTPGGEVEARGMAMQHDETAYGVLGSEGEYEGNIQNPYANENKRGDIVASDDPGQRQIWKEMPRHSAQAQRSTPPVTIRLPRGGRAGGSFR